MGVLVIQDSRPIRVLIVDDHPMVRQGLRTFLELQDDMTVVGEAGDGSEAVKLVSAVGADVVLMDIMMPRLNGVEAIREIKRLDSDVSIVALTSFTGDEHVMPAIEAGASGYLHKDVTPEELAEAVRAANRGEARLHPDALRKVMETAVETRSDVAPEPAIGILTERELEIVRLVARGMSNREIADELFISEKTVKTHVGHVLAKLELKDRTQLAVYALTRGLAQPPRVDGGNWS